MLSALISFLGGSAFRMIWGEVSAWITAKQDHQQELDRMKLQGELDAAAHARNLEAMRVQNELGIKTIEVQSNADLAKIDASAWADAVSAVGRTTGIKIIDIWNGAIRPALATLAMVFLFTDFVSNGFILSYWDKGLVAAILGIYLADRTLMKRGK